MCQNTSWPEAVTFWRLVVTVRWEAVETPGSHYTWPRSGLAHITRASCFPLLLVFMLS